MAQLAADLGSWLLADRTTRAHLVRGGAAKDCTNFVDGVCIYYVIVPERLCNIRQLLISSFHKINKYLQQTQHISKMHSAYSTAALVALTTAPVLICKGKT
jgi:hypothetical protein